MPDWKNTLGGAASGAGAGATIGSVIPGVGTGIGAAVGGGLGLLMSLFGGDDDEAQAAAAKREKLYHDLFNQYMGPDSASQQALARLEKLSETGMSDEDRAAAYNLLDQANTMARGREGAVAQEMAQRGQGASNSGLEYALRDQASQAAAQRQTAGEVGIAGEAARRRQAALQSYLEQKARNDQMLMSWKLAVTGGQSDALKGIQDLAERKNYADTENLYHGLDSLTTAGLYAKKYGGAATKADGGDAALSSGAGWTGAETPTSLPSSARSASMTMAPSYDTPSPTTVAANLPPSVQARHLDQFGMYDLSPLTDEQYRPQYQ